MYKRQFLKWNWKKYNTKSRQQSHTNGEILETRRGKFTCKRPTRQCIISLTTRHAIALVEPTISTLLLHENEAHQWVEELYTILRDLIYGSAQQFLAWRDCSKFDLLAGGNFNFVDQFTLSFKLLKENDLPHGGAVLRQAFHTVDIVIEKESFSFFQRMLLDIPFILLDRGQNNELQIYLQYVFQMLDVKKPGEPIATMARAMHLTGAEAPTQLLHSLTLLHDMTVDYFADIRGEDDINSLDARLETRRFREKDEFWATNCKIVFRSFSDLLSEAIDLFGEGSEETFKIAFHHIYAMWYLSYWDDFESLCERYISHIRADNKIFWDDWDFLSLDGLAWALKYLSDFYLESGNTSSCISRLEENIQIPDYIADNYENVTGSEVQAIRSRMKLCEVLSTIGRLLGPRRVDWTFLNPHF
ncbi:n1-acetylpolyamine oxidase [Colletotrichum incanum]|uniref:N1-acetylpolyamine oxidase n=1 Tax=Colletotrichum incanum TaxID=1573173 RepID=A0A166S3U1_COLIC|nr:n1-acetylpolyamine oxidase [Colletotrichum incanum]